MNRLLLIIAAGLVFSPAVSQNKGISIGGFIQSQYSYTSFDGKVQKSAFEIRRARLDINGSFNSKVSFRFLTEMAGTPALLDVSANYRFNRYAIIKVGQFKNPFSLANQLSPLDECSAETMLPVSSYIGRPGNHAGGYDNGIMLSGSAFPYESQSESSFDLLSYSIAVMNGGPINSRNDDNTDKNITRRVDFKPFIKELTLSASGIKGNYSNSSNGGSMFSNLERIGGGIQYNGRLVVRSEFFAANTETWTGFENRTVKSNSWYAQAYYWMDCGENGKISPVLAYDYIDRNIDQTRDEISNLVIGAEYWPNSNLRLLVNYRMTTDSSLTKYINGFYTQAAVRF